MGGIEGVCVWKECECFPLQISIQLSPLPEKTLRKSPKCWPQEDANLPSGDEEDEETKPEATLLGSPSCLEFGEDDGESNGRQTHSNPRYVQASWRLMVWLPL